MRSLQMVDLKQQYLKIKSEIDTAVLDVLESTAFINGPQVQRFAALWGYHNSAECGALCQWNGCPADRHDGAGSSARR
jgi:dTDP-4-amino-4,6-dideoxygalactose transaminase